MEDLQGVGFPFLSYLWQPDIEIHHVREVREPKVMGQFLAGLQINRGVRREVLLSQVTTTPSLPPFLQTKFPGEKVNVPVSTTNCHIKYSCWNQISVVNVSCNPNNIN